MNISFDGKVVVITGAAGGIGTALAANFAADKAKVALCDLKGAKQAAEKLSAQTGGCVLGYEFDITDREAVNKAMEEIARSLGKISVLINNAGINVGPDERKTVDKFNDKWWDAIIRVDLDGTYNCSKAAVPYMTENASIINTSSIVGMIPLRNQCAFAAAKAAVINFTKAMAIELAPKGIRANVICPGSVGIDITNELWKNNSTMQGLISHIPMGRQAKPDEIAYVAEFLACDLSSYVTGAVIPVDGGWTCGFARDF